MHRFLGNLATELAETLHGVGLLLSSSSRNGRILLRACRSIRAVARASALSHLGNQESGHYCTRLRVHRPGGGYSLVLQAETRTGSAFFHFPNVSITDQPWTWVSTIIDSG
jgi:hypothetical protein